jgi:NAD(P)-dependent dehydrogenase (short-subunit alcohol dehydrogenase family)
MCWCFKALFHLLRVLLFFFWDGFKALLSPCRGKRSQADYGEEICLITGAAQGLGKQLALEFAGRNAVLVLCDIQEEKLKAAADEIKEMGAEVHSYVCDCSSREDVYRVAAQVQRDVGSVSILVNNAGILNVRPLMEAEDEEIERTFKINTLAHFWVRY